jgi:hypothetical protein
VAHDGIPKASSMTISPISTGLVLCSPMDLCISCTSC